MFDARDCGNAAQIFAPLISAACSIIAREKYRDPLEQQMRFINAGRVNNIQRGLTILTTQKKDSARAWLPAILRVFKEHSLRDLRAFPRRRLPEREVITRVNRELRGCTHDGTHNERKQNNRLHGFSWLFAHSRAMFVQWLSPKDLAIIRSVHASASVGFLRFPHPVIRCSPPFLYLLHTHADYFVYLLVCLPQMRGTE